MCDRGAASSLHAQQVSPRPGTEIEAAAQRELAAFYEAVSEMYGPEEAMLAALDWIEALEKIAPVADGSPPDWRLMTIAAAGGLASRVLSQTADRRRTDC